MVIDAIFADIDGLIRKERDRNTDIDVRKESNSDWMILVLGSFLAVHLSMHGKKYTGIVVLTALDVVLAIKSERRSDMECIVPGVQGQETVQIEEDETRDCRELISEDNSSSQ